MDTPTPNRDPGDAASFAAFLYSGYRERGRHGPSHLDAAHWLATVLHALFPERGEQSPSSSRDILSAIERHESQLLAMLRVLRPRDAADVLDAFRAQLPGIHRVLLQDADAILSGDPAARSLSEVIATYPGFWATAVQRLAHALHVLGVPTLPRMMTEQAHATTGIDIHPGASIGPGLCIDHGTGVVIGETAVLGAGVKLYQGVTLGALSVEKSAAGTKRHPTLGDRVTVYSGATILGGDTVIGAGSIIGGNAWITKSVPPATIVNSRPEQLSRRIDSQPPSEAP